MKSHRWNIPTKTEMTDMQYLLSAVVLTVFLSSFFVLWAIIIWSWVS